MVNRQNRIMLICLLLLSTMAGCGQSAMSESTATIQPTATPIPGWEKYEVDNVEIWLPESFEGGNLNEDIDMIVEKLRSFGPDFEHMAQLIEQNPTMIIVWAFDSEVGDSGIITTVNITTEKVISAMTVNTYLDAVINQLPVQFQVQESGIVSLGDYQETGRLVVELEVPGAFIRELMYVVKNGNTMWNITFATGAEEYNNRLPVFEQIALTFKVQP
jgi:hypothetical protein